MRVQGGVQGSVQGQRMAAVEIVGRALKRGRAGGRAGDRQEASAAPGLYVVVEEHFLVSGGAPRLAVHCVNRNTPAPFGIHKLNFVPQHGNLTKQSPRGSRGGREGRQCGGRRVEWRL